MAATSGERLVAFAMQIFCDNLEAQHQLDVASLVEQFQDNLRASNHGITLRRPDSLRELLTTTCKLPIDKPFSQLLRCIRECALQPESLLKTLHLSSDTESWKLHHLSTCDALRPDVLGNDILCQFLTDIGAGEIHGYAACVPSFLRRLIESKPTDWYESLVLAAVYVENRDLLMQIAPFGDGFAAELPTLQEQLEHPITDERFDAEFQRARSSVLDRTARWTSQNLVRLDPDSLRLTSVPEQQPPPMSPTPTLGNGLRLYQEELAEPAVAGRNSIVIAPTGSGKTMVAIWVTQAVLERDPNARVVFLVPTTHLVQQQFKEFQECLPQRWRDRVCHIHGRSEETVRLPFSQALKEYSVLVVSTQILLNELTRPVNRDGLGGDVSAFRLIVFDECHSCLGNHPSSQVMLHYMRQKRSLEAATATVNQKRRRLPQILGLTASPGTGKAARLEDAVEHLVKLCASLDCSRPVTVQRHLASMLEVTSDPDCHLHPVGSKRRDRFNELINQLMAKGEELMHHYREQLPPCDVNGLPATVPPRCSPSYVNYCANIKYNMHLATDHRASKNLHACSRYLGSCNKAQMIAQFFRSVDALSFLEQQLRPEDEMAKPAVCEAEKELRQRLDDLMPELFRFCHESSDAKASPPLDKLVAILTQQFAQQPNSRAIVFVQEKFYARVLAEYLNGVHKLGQATTFVTGAASAGAAGGTKAPEQEARLEDFRQGKFKVMSCTSVTEEGLDIPACNLVVRFCHVTNEISMVQSKGRGRAKDSAYHVIIAENQDWLYDKERVNQQRDKLMRDAVQRVTDMDGAALEVKMAEYQAIWLGKAGGGGGGPQQKQQQQQQLQQQERHEFDLVCQKCRTLLTQSSRLRLIDGIHRVALDVALFSDRVRGKGGESRKLGHAFEKVGIDLVCARCGVLVAKVVCHSRLHFPLIAVEGVLFMRADTQEMQRPARKWKQTEDFLRVEPLTASDKLAWARLMPQLPESLREQAAS